MTETPWTKAQKFAFCFFFLFLGSTSYRCLQIIVTRFFFGQMSNEQAYKFLIQPVHWLDRNIYHLGYNPQVHYNGPGDGYFGAVFYLTLIILSFAGAILWTLLDRKRTDYSKLFFWFSVYLRYVLAFRMLMYGFAKLIPNQMRYPMADSLLTLFGEKSRFALVWDFMGASPGYEMFTGFCEVFAGLLLLFRRTAVAGLLLMTFILCNVVALNIFYNIVVKTFSLQLLLISLFLLVPYMRKIIQFLFYKEPVVLSEKRYSFQTRWKKYTLTSFLTLISVVFLFFEIRDEYKRHQQLLTVAANQKMYEVTHFIAKDTLPPLLTDTLRWQRFLTGVGSNGNNAIICDMKGVQNTFQCKVDSVHKTFSFHNSPDTREWRVFHNSPDTAKWLVFHYTCPAKDQLQLTGKWKGNDVSIWMKELSIGDMRLNKEKIHFLVE